MLRNYKIILIIWIAVGILFGGYFLIEPMMVKIEVLSLYGGHYAPAKFEEVDLKLGQKILLIIFVGVILIGGLGFISSSNNKKEINF